MQERQDTEMVSTAALVELLDQLRGLELRISTLEIKASASLPVRSRAPQALPRSRGSHSRRRRR